MSVIDVATKKVIRTIPVGDEPHGVLTDHSGQDALRAQHRRPTASRSSTPRRGEEVKAWSASRSPWSLALSPDGSQILVTNTLSRFVEFRTPSMSEVTVIDTAARAGSATGGWCPRRTS